MNRSTSYSASFLAGFLSNGVLFRLSGKINDNDIIFPIILLSIIFLGILLGAKTKED